MQRDKPTVSKPYKLNKASTLMVGSGAKEPQADVSSKMLQRLNNVGQA